MTGLELTAKCSALCVIGIYIILNSRFRYKNIFINKICNIILAILYSVVFTIAILSALIYHF